MNKTQRLAAQRDYILHTQERTDISEERKQEILESAVGVLENLTQQLGTEPWWDTEAEAEFKAWYKNQCQ